MSKIISYIRITIALSFIFYISIGSAHAASLSFSGSVLSIDVDTGISAYTGTTVGDTFIGNFIFGDVASDATTSGVSLLDGGVPVAYEYEFSGSPYGSAITDGMVTTSSSFSAVEIDNNAPISVDEANMLNDLFGSSITGGTLFDSWAAFGQTDGAFVDANDNLIDGREFGIILWFDPAVYSDLDFRATPPDLSDVDYGIFFILEADAVGNEVFVAIGSVDSSTPVPIPASAWLFCTGLLGLFVLNKHKKITI